VNGRQNTKAITFAVLTKGKHRHRNLPNNCNNCAQTPSLKFKRLPRVSLSLLPRALTKPSQHAHNNFQHIQVMVASKKLSITSTCCLLVGSAHSFLAPEPSLTTTTRRRRTHNCISSSPYGHTARTKTRSTTTILTVHTPSRSSSRSSPPADSEEDTSRRDNISSSNNVLDDFWTVQSAQDDADAVGGGLQTDHDADSKIIYQQESVDSTKWILVGGTVAVLVAAGALAVTLGDDLGIDLELGQLIKDPSASFDIILASLETMDVERGMIYFSSFYVLAEILAIPAVPILTASSGYLFGTALGTATCLFSASIAASISFVIGRTLLRGYVERVLDNNPKFRSMDSAIEREGFKLMLLLRLSPLFPFALSNYLYGASSIRFAPYFFGTLLGFAPGTFAYVYAGRIGKALTMDSATSEPWYVYVGGMAVVLALVKVAGDVASNVIDSMEEGGEDGGWDGGDMDI